MVSVQVAGKWLPRSDSGKGQERGRSMLHVDSILACKPRFDRCDKRILGGVRVEAGQSMTKTDGGYALSNRSSSDHIAFNDASQIRAH